MTKQIQIAIIVAIVLGIGIIGLRQFNQPEQKDPSLQQAQNKEDDEMKIKEIRIVEDLIGGEYDIQPIDTSDWKIHKNNKYLFYLKLPEEIQVQQTDFPEEYQIFVFDSKQKSLYKKEIGIEFVAYERFHDKQFADLSEKDFFVEPEDSFIATGNIDSLMKRKNILGNELIIIKTINKKAPLDNPKFKELEETGPWIEGAYKEEAYFQCGKSICTLMIHSDTFSKDKQTFFYTILSTLNINNP